MSQTVESRCRRCKRILTVTKSRRRGYGPVCFKKMMNEHTSLEKWIK